MHDDTIFNHCRLLRPAQVQLAAPPERREVYARRLQRRRLRVALQEDGVLQNFQLQVRGHLSTMSLGLRSILINLASIVAASTAAAPSHLPDAITVSSPTCASTSTTPTGTWSTRATGARTGCFTAPSADTATDLATKKEVGAALVASITDLMTGCLGGQGTV